MSANDMQVAGTYYLDLGLYQPWSVMKAWMTPEQYKGYLLGTAIAYLARFNVEGVSGKGGMQDIGKAAHTLAYMVEACDGRD